MVTLNTSATIPTAGDAGPAWATEITDLLTKLDAGGSMLAKAKGAVGDGSTDDCSAINTGIAALSSAGGGVFQLPPGTFALGTKTGTLKSLIQPKSNVWLRGSGEGATVLKVKNSMNTGAGGFFMVISPVDSTSGNTINKFFLSDLTIDFNGANNLTATGQTDNYAYGLAIYYGADLAVWNVNFLNNPGQNSVLYGTNTSPRTVTRAYVGPCTYNGFGDAVSGNTHQTDHSAVFAACEDFTSSGTTFTNGTKATGTAMELHCLRASVDNAVGSNVHTAFNIGAQFQDAESISITNADFTGITTAAKTYVNAGKKLKRLSVEGSFVQDTGAESLFNFYSNTLGKIEEVRIGGHGGYSGSAAAAYETGVVTGCNIRYLDVDVTFSDLLGGALIAYANTGGADTADGDMVIDLDDAALLDCGRTTTTGGAKFAVKLYAASSALIGAVSLRGTRCINTTTGAGGITQLLDCNMPIPLVKIIDPLVQGVAFPQYTATQTLASTDVWYVRAQFACSGSSPALQNMPATEGSEILDTGSTTGAKYVKRAAGNAVGGWKSIDYGTAAPGSGAYQAGDTRLHPSPASGGYIGFVCTTAGSPGTWKTYGLIS